MIREDGSLNASMQELNIGQDRIKEAKAIGIEAAIARSRVEDFNNNVEDQATAKKHHLSSQRAHILFRASERALKREQYEDWTESNRRQDEPASEWKKQMVTLILYTGR
jgi:hypothetical protein